MFQLGWPSIKKIWLFLGIFSLGIFCPKFLWAASMYFSPSTGAYAVGTNFTVGIYGESADQAVNAASGHLLFPSDKLEVVSVSQNGSIFNLWVQEPFFSNSRGFLNFEGVVLDPGYQGKSGKLLLITFRAKAPGMVSLVFSDGLMLANDGKGTNILKSLGKATFTLGKVEPQAAEATTPLGTVLSAPVINSPTHPEPNVWYNQTTAIFNWQVSDGVVGVRTAFDNLPQTVPSFTQPLSPAIKEIKNIGNGVWYFHIRSQNSEGWGSVAHFRVQVDTESPEYIKINALKREDMTDPVVQFIFESRDRVSGLGEYEIWIDGATYKLPAGSEKIEYATPPLLPGTHKIIFKVFDRAGNYLAEAMDLEILPLKTPEINEYPRRLWSGDVLSIRGHSEYNDAEAVIWWQNEDDAEPSSASVKISANGNFIFVLDEKLKPGVYSFWVEAVDARGGKSLPTDKFNFMIEREDFLRLGGMTFGLPVLIVFFISLLGILGLILLFAWRHCQNYKKYIDNNVKKTIITLSKTFELLKDHILERIEMMARAKGRNQVDKQEEKLMEQLLRDLSDAETFLEKNVRGINKK